MFRVYFYQVFFLLVAVNLSAQNKCPLGSNNHESMERITKYLSEHKSNQNSTHRHHDVGEDNIYQLPVVFHVLYSSNEENIPDKQIFIQMKSLNEDFRRMNADTVNTPMAFYPIAADTKIAFKLAERAPDGSSTTGITRTKIEPTRFNLTNSIDRRKITDLISWKSSQYINVWVVETIDLQLGYGIFPMLADDNDDSDGVFVKYTHLGQGRNADKYSRGRTLTHEIGHFLGLDHVFAGDDGCDDTPCMKSATSSSLLSCDKTNLLHFCDNEKPKMIENYLDYSSDICMNLFTNCQKAKMRAVLENIGKRNLLFSSPGLYVPNDLAMKRVIPSSQICSTTFWPSIEVQNNGTNDIKNYEIQFTLDDEVIQTVNFTNEISKGRFSRKISLSPIEIDNTIEHHYSYTITSVNNEKDGNEENNTIEGLTCLVNDVFTASPSVIRSDKLNISINTKLESPVHILLLNTSGKAVINKTVSGEHNRIDLSLPKLQQGLYILNLSSNHISEKEKIIIAN